MSINSSNVPAQGWVECSSIRSIFMSDGRKMGELTYRQDINTWQFENKSTRLRYFQNPALESKADTAIDGVNLILMDIIKSPVTLRDYVIKDLSTLLVDKLEDYNMLACILFDYFSSMDSWFKEQINVCRNRILKNELKEKYKTLLSFVHLHTLAYGPAYNSIAYDCLFEHRFLPVLRDYAEDTENRELLIDVSRLMSLIK